MFLVIQTIVDGPKWVAIEICSSKLRTPLYSVVRMLDPAPNGHIAWIQSRPHPWVQSLAVVLHGSSWRWLVNETRMPYIDISPAVRPPSGLLFLRQRFLLCRSESLNTTYSGTSIIQTPLGPYQTVLFIEVSLVWWLVDKHAFLASQAI